MPDTTDRRRASHPDSRIRRQQAATDHVAAAWVLIEAGYRTDDGASVPRNKARAVEHLEAAIAVIRGEHK
jgi:hypothetical protein